MPARLRPTAPIAPAAILVGDPGRALLLAQDLLEQPKMSNHARGLWGYSGATAAGIPLTIQATGMGGPSASVVLTDLAELGVRRAVRIGTCAGIDPSLRPGDLVVVSEATADPVRSTLVGQDATNVRLAPDGEMRGRLEGALGGCRVGSVVSLDVLPDPGSAVTGQADVADMQTAALFARGPELGVAVAAVLVVAETRTGVLPEEDLEAAAKTLGAAAAASL